METKDQLNQNPVDDNKPQQEENSEQKTSDLKPEETATEPAEEKETTKEKPTSKVEKEKSEPTDNLQIEDSVPETSEEKIKEPEQETVQEKPEEVEEAKTELPEVPVTEAVEETTVETNKPEEIKVPEVVVEIEEPVKEEKEVATSETKTEPVEKTEEEVSELTAKSDLKEDSKEEIPETEASTDAIETETKDESTVSEATDTEDQDEDEDEDDDDPEEEEHEQPIDYESLSLEELVSNLEEILSDGEVEKIRNKVSLIKVSFLKKNKERQEKIFENFIAEGGVKEDFNQEKDDIEIRFQAASQIYHEKRKQFMAEQEKIKQKNLEGKNLVLVELKALIESEESLKKTYDEFKNLQEKWKNIGMVPKAEVNTLWQNYHFYVEKFFDKVKINNELRDLDLKKNMELKLELCEKAEELLLETSVLKSFKKLQQYHTEWKEIGPISQDKKDEVWERFKTATDKINDLRREHYNSLRDEQKKNLEAKTALCEKAEELIQIENNSIKDWQGNTDKISELLKIWKTIGQAPRQQNDEIWERFKTSLDTFFAGKKEYFQQIKDEQMNNYNLKLDLCTQAEAIKGNTDWKKTTQELINLQKEWKNIGPVPKRHSDKIWKRFRSACDEFFNNKSDYFGNIKQHEADNQKLKEELIAKVETFEFGTDKNENLDVLKGFQREFTEIGHVPFKEKDRLQNSFRDAINKQFDKLKISRSEVQKANYTQRFENLKDNPNADRILYNERNFLAQKRKKLEDEINLLENNMGFFAQSKNADLLKLELSKKIEKAREEITQINEKIKFLEREAK